MLMLLAGLAGCAAPAQQRCLASPGAGTAFGQELELTAKVFPKVSTETLLLASLKGLARIDADLTVSLTTKRGRNAIVLHRGDETDVTTIDAISEGAREATPNILLGARKISPAIAMASQDKIEGEMVEALLSAYPHSVECLAAAKPLNDLYRHGDVCEQFEPELRFTRFDEVLARAYRVASPSVELDMLVMAGLKGLADLDPELLITRQEWGVMLRKPGATTRSLSLMKVISPGGELAAGQQFVKKVTDVARHVSPQVDAAGEVAIQGALVSALVRSYRLPDCTDGENDWPDMRGGPVDPPGTGQF